MSRTLSKKQKQEIANQLLPDERLYEATITIRFASALPFIEACNQLREYTDAFKPSKRADGYEVFTVVTLPRRS